tara:strand:- start:10748 stop:11416 length:669 start_codon:yes stop_codon:yes gene_type:complete
MQKEEIKFNYDLGLFGDTLNRIILREYPHRLQDFINSFSGNQVLCKKWLVTELKKLLIKRQYLSKSKITILGSWYGNIIVPLLVDNIEGIKDIQLIDMDEDALDIGRKFLTRKYNGVNIHYFKEDINFTDFSDWYTNIVINTSCEHMIPMSSISFKDDQFVLYMLQSNNMKGQREHINCVNNTIQLEKQSDINKNFYSGEKKLVGQNKELYKRFMVIGKRDG